jgi:hypothetical protein
VTPGIVAVDRKTGDVSGRIVLADFRQLLPNVFDERTVIADEHDKKRFRAGRV